MGGTREGGKKAAETIRLKHGNDFFAKIGSKGGRNGHAGGFATMPYEKVAACGRIGGHRSKRGKQINDVTKLKIYQDYNAGIESVAQIAEKYGISPESVRRIVRNLSPF